MSGASRVGALFLLGAIACDTPAATLSVDASTLVGMPRVPGSPLPDAGPRPDSGVVPDAATPRDVGVPDVEIPDAGPGLMAFFRDRDHDGFTGSELTTAASDPDGAGLEWVAAPTVTDCDDDPSFCGAKCFPGNAAADSCDTYDQDCDNFIDEEPELAWSPDRDGDGRGAANVTPGCSAEPGWVSNGGDCDDRIAECSADCSNCPYNPPVAVFVVSPSAGTTTTTFSFDARRSHDSEDGAELKFWWDFEADGTYEGGTQDLATLDRTFGAFGPREVRLRVEDSTGLTSDFVGWVRITGADRLITVTTGSDAPEPAPDTSLREAIELANARPGTTVIRFERPIVVQLESSLPLVTDPGTWIAGIPGAVIQGGPEATDYCLKATSDRFTAMWLEIRGCVDDGLEVGANEGWVANSFFHDNGDDGIDFSGNLGRAYQNISTGNGDAGIELEGDELTVEGNRIAGNSIGILMLRQGRTLDSATIIGNDVYENGVGVRMEPLVTGAKLWNNTFAENSGPAIEVVASADGTSLALDHDVQNNIFAHNAGHALVLDGSIGTFDVNDVYRNAGTCTGCETGPTELNVDPGFVDSASHDYRLAPGSLCVDRGSDLGVDRNGPSDGAFGSLAVDLGAHESF
ncbi:MAG: right-handed parallel beta-helix repeat-containing protein [Deltaproteobacteria bacterium]|nr:right-handed parallel beta-helix repeat-containing protein [Deltaproteobacteria bacterium]